MSDARIQLTRATDQTTIMNANTVGNKHTMSENGGGPVSVPHLSILIKYNQYCLRRPLNRLRRRGHTG